jgi:hypothetical protein
MKTSLVLFFVVVFYLLGAERGARPYRDLVSGQTLPPAVKLEMAQISLEQGRSATILAYASLPPLLVLAFGFHFWRRRTDAKT